MYDKTNTQSATPRLFIQFSNKKMGFYLAFTKLLLLDIAPSLFDVLSDVVANLNHLGYNATSFLTPGFITDIIGEGDPTEYTVNPIWGSIGLAFIFAPGIPIAIFAIFLMLSEGWNQRVQ